jgi:hypothetical protein
MLWQGIKPSKPKKESEVLGVIPTARALPGIMIKPSQYMKHNFPPYGLALDRLISHNRMSTP